MVTVAYVELYTSFSYLQTAKHASTLSLDFFTRLDARPDAVSNNVRAQRQMTIYNLMT